MIESARGLSQWLVIRKRERRARCARPGRILQLELLEPYILLSYVVTNINTSGPGSLTQAILDADRTGGGTINFNIRGSGAAKISTSGLPSLTARIVIDATTQPGYSGRPLVTIQGPGTVGTGLNIQPGGKGSKVCGLAISGFTNGVLVNNSADITLQANVISGNSGNGIILNGPGASGNLISGNEIGTDPTGQSRRANFGYGVTIVNGASRNTIGGTTAAARNIISGNAFSGITITGAGTSRNLVEGNLIGTDAAARKALGNVNNGIVIDRGATNNTIGGTTAGARNVIAGNGRDGIRISDSGTSGSLVVGNFLGTNGSGTAAIGNGASGVQIAAGASNNTIGGTSVAARNIVSGNGYDGIAVHDFATSGNLIEGNLIGTDVNGGKVLPNAGNGVEVFEGGGNTTIGGTSSAARNIISGNLEDGVALRSGATGVLIAGNFIGTDLKGSLALPNSGNGVNMCLQATNNTIGGTVAGAANVISGNNEYGVSVSDKGTSANVISRNLIGTGASGRSPLPNASVGVVLLNGASGNTIGGTTAGAGNVISGNRLSGIVLTDHGTTNNLIGGNLVGTDRSGSRAVGNGDYGLVVSNGASSNTIGGTSGPAGNVVSGNAYSGISFWDSGTSANLVQGNYIGTDKSGTRALANGNNGIDLTTGVSNNTIGGTTAGAGNVISSNPYAGIAIGDPHTSGNLIQGNLIGTDRTGAVALPNEEGINLYHGASNNTIGGTTAAARNLLSGNSDNGIDIHDPGTSGNLIQGNLIGTDAKGTGAVPNQGDGVLVINQASRNSIGGTVAGAGNTIAFNIGNGIAVGESRKETVAGVAINNNAIFANVQLGIDLIDDGVTLNSTGGAKSGPNKLQNFPVLTSATKQGSTVTVQGTLNSAPNAVFRLEFYVNPVSDPTGYSEGQTQLGATTVTTNGTGTTTFVAALTAVVPVVAGQVVTATATDASGNTSEFSRERMID